jgi:hypothetical protein
MMIQIPKEAIDALGKLMRRFPYETVEDNQDNQWQDIPARIRGKESSLKTSKRLRRRQRNG